MADDSSGASLLRKRSATEVGASLSMKDEKGYWIPLIPVRFRDFFTSYHFQDFYQVPTPL
jgi:hypothetical protein